MEIRVLKYFLTVVREGSITKAAEVLHITQPTLSRQLSQLEEETGVRLLIRGSKKTTLTTEGLLLKRRAEEILDLVYKTSQELAGQDEQVEGVVSIGSGELKGVEILADICCAFRKKYPLVRFDMYTATADVVKERMDRGLIDIGLLLEPVDMERFDFIRPIGKEQWAVMMRADDPLARNEAITAQELKGLPLILPRRLNVQSELAHWFGDSFENLEVAFTGNLTTNAAVIVSKGCGYAVVIEGSLPFGEKDNIVSRPLSPPLSATTVLAWKRGNPFGIATEKFIDFVKCFLGMAKA